MKYLFLMTTLLFCFSCKNSTPNKSNARTVESNEFKLTIEHTGCRGYCPMYTITVEGSGHTTYNGRRSVDMIGIYTKTISKEKVKELQALLAESKFTEFDENYGPVGVDIPGVITTCSMGGNVHKVCNIKDAPESLNVMQKRMEGIIGLEGFTKMSEK